MRFGLPSPVTPIMEGIISLHNYVMFYLIIIFLFVLSLLVNIYFTFTRKFLKPTTAVDLQYRLFLIKNTNFNHASLLEIIWTIIPTLVLVLIAFPSLALLYAIDELFHPVATLKVTGHQWYWSYHWVLSKFPHLFTEFDSYLVPETELKFGEPRLLKTDNPVFLPSNINIRVLVTADDVLHSWSVPSFGIKIDCVPGRLNQVNLFIERFGQFFGQCSELCGVNHGFMPIEIISSDLLFPLSKAIENIPTFPKEIEPLPKEPSPQEPEACKPKWLKKKE